MLACIFWLIPLSGLTQGPGSSPTVLVGSAGDTIQPQARAFSKSARPDSWFAPDKGKHLLAGTIATVFFQQASYRMVGNKMQSKRISISLAATTSVLKEVWDLRVKKSHFCFKDLCFDALGIGVGIILINQ